MFAIVRKTTAVSTSVRRGIDFFCTATDLKGCHASNDRVAESVFGALKYERRRLPGISGRRASGLAQSRLMKSMAHDDAVQHRKSSRNPVSNKRRRVDRNKEGALSFGYFHRLPSTEAVALIEMARAEREALRAVDREDEKELDAFRAARRKTNSQLELDSLIKQFALALSFFDRYVVTSIHR